MKGKSARQNIENILTEGIDMISELGGNMEKVKPMNMTKG
jgi:hypothetical protein